ncbi:hypothetical protein [Pseudonocardia sp.]|jgi:hypothetical protein|uniref:hypothetical protein n=1 Tax=Pseudonocardia sp. TaxID=60912 RepID=UPI00262A0261|nr:hypothetical protein [Pseudonocardia sp.]MCW2717322.1 amidohydrolase 2 [Pseudonocardia sp.]
MPLQPWMKMLSTDDHLIEHPKLWSGRLPKKFLEAGPHIVEQPRPNGGPPSEVWSYEGRILPLHRAERGGRQEAGGVRR